VLYRNTNSHALFAAEIQSFVRENMALSAVSPWLAARSCYASSFSKGALQNDICRFESYMPSQPVRSPLRDFRVCENRRHSRGLGWRALVSGWQILEFCLWTGGFAAPVSGRHFPISVSAYPRPVRYVPETGLRSRFRACTAAKVERWIDCPVRGKARRRRSWPAEPRIAYHARRRHEICGFEILNCPRLKV
jgi:hypothetical protein